jgi:transposase-like protein
MARKRDTNAAQNLQMARLSIVDKMSYSEIADKFGLGTKNTVGMRMKEIREEYPELVTAMESMASYVPEVQPIVETQLQELTDSLEANAPLADKIELQVHTLLDISEDDIKAMKPEHRLRHVSNLVSVMRLLREESTQNVKKVSLVRCVGLATERRERREGSNPTN